MYSAITSSSVSAFFPAKNSLVQSVHGTSSYLSMTIRVALEFSSSIPLGPFSVRRLPEAPDFMV